MPYRHSEIDKKNLRWFSKNIAQATLLKIELRRGSLRGLQKSAFHFRYPITAIAGRNGTGKTTALALAACAYHHSSSSYNPLNRKHAHYTFSDFFVQTAEEVAPQGIEIAYEILSDSWRPSKRLPEGKGAGWQFRTKRQGGKWNDYGSRASRNVVVYGIERIVPATERSVFRSYRRKFRKQPPQGWEESVRAAMSRILGKNYKEIWFTEYRKYLLPMIRINERVLSGFNLGAGENALISILTGILACDEPLLIIIDEIELGLHEEAQLQLVRELKKLCSERHIQIVCTTHSPAILGALPPEARLFLEESGKVTEGISVDYAAGRLSGNPEAVVDILVEDEVAQSIIKHSLQTELRSRVRVLPIGSAAAVIRHLAAKRRDPHARETIVFLDGDMESKKESFCKQFENALESSGRVAEDRDWLSLRMGFLPGREWPERWILKSLLESSLETAAKDLRVDENSLKKALEKAAAQPRHDELAYAAKALALDGTYARERLTRLALDASPGDLVQIIKLTQEALERASS